ncbi:hypothetical protein F511_46532 [Dorcoceras hygrometricum]|uniref:Uncharacterized protein n=1 Tax=Dorcoceras hygrometricum TaxID=472368 RepID=A0A2Z7A055_9LAMI|nr:hypothetical protein F511_46532 [Dorcoceras hygrometricum]
MKIQQMRRGASYDMSCDDISLDVITISRWLSADEAKRKESKDQQKLIAVEEYISSEAVDELSKMDVNC